jgi:hypothetical protein
MTRQKSFIGCSGTISMECYRDSQATKGIRYVTYW